MSPLLSIAREEWRLWSRSRLVLASILLMALLVLATSVLNVVQMNAERHARLHYQSEAEQRFLNQPDRHPHRMVHYGHYAFRTPAPLAIFDRGLDPVTGQAIFLEGHQQNTAMFAEAGAGAKFSGLPYLSTALVYQVFGPLLLILLGHAAVARERESGTLAPLLAQGVSGRQLLAGKALALIVVVGALLLPLLPVVALALGRGESPLVAGLMVTLYGLYLLVWSGLVLVASALLRKRSLVLASLISVWVLMVLILPALAVSVTADRLPAPGKVETDLAIRADLREVGDGHQSEDPAFVQLRDNLLEEHGVEKVEDLPINFRGMVAQYAEAKLTDVLNEYAEQRMAIEAAQASAVQRFGWLSPTLSVSFASRALAGTDLANHHRFLREAEALRFDFVQSLNQVHAQELSYEDDINRNLDAESGQRARVAAENWALLERFQFKPAPASDRTARATTPMVALVFWLGLMLCAAVAAGRRLTL